MHEAAFAALGLDHHYRALDVNPSELPAAVAALRLPDVLGANVTIPHKVRVHDLVDARTPAAEAIGAVNTVVRTGAGLEGDNTDAEGFLAAAAELGLEPEGATCVVLGGGGAARAVVWGLASAGARVRVHNRNRARAADLQRSMAAHGRVELVAEGGLETAVATADLLVNATSVGMHGADAGSPLPEAWLPTAGAVIDLVYRPAETLLLRRAGAAGLRVQNGLPMLVHQGAASARRWLGVDPPLAVMRAAAEAALRS